MENNDNLPLTIHQIATPMFSVRNGIVAEVNNAAKILNIVEGMPINTMIWNCQDEYKQFQSGKLFLTLEISGVKFKASATVADKTHIFAIDTSSTTPAAHINIDFAKTLREPLSTAVTHIDLMYNAAIASNNQDTKSFLVTRQNLFRMLRSVQNLLDSDPHSKEATHSHFEYRDIISYLNNCILRLQQKTSLKNLFKINTLNKKIICRFDPNALERALLNLLANAIKHSTGKKPAVINLQHNDDKLYITVRNQLKANDSTLQTAITSVVSDSPFVNPYDAEIGCGIKVVRNIALEHGGTLQMRILQCGDCSLQEAEFVMTISTANVTPYTLCSPTHLIIDHSGGYDRILIDMAELLTPEDYK